MKKEKSSLERDFRKFDADTGDMFRVRKGQTCKVWGIERFTGGPFLKTDEVFIVLRKLPSDHWACDWGIIIFVPSMSKEFVTSSLCLKNKQMLKFVGNLKKGRKRFE